VRTALTDLLAIEHPIIQASIGPWSSVALTAAVSNAGAIGSLGTALKTPREIARQIEATRERTDKPFIVNHTRRPLSQEAFELTLAYRPKAVSLALGDPGDLAERAHAGGALFIAQVHTREQALRAVEQGADALIAQGDEAGGFGGGATLMVVLPQIADAVAPTPVVAAGGIADGRGLAAAIVLGAAGANLGTRFLAAAETEIADDWKQRIVDATAQDTLRPAFADHVFPPPDDLGYATLPRVLHTQWVDALVADPGRAAAHGRELGEELLAAVKQGRGHELIPFTGQSAGLITDVRPAAEIVHTMVTDAERALRASV
jgi:enoyl-[acyl-carrier protein] reductase II